MSFNCLKATVEVVSPAIVHKVVVVMMLRQVYNADYMKHGVGHVLLMATAERECGRDGAKDINLVNDYPWCRRWSMEQTRYHRFHLLRKRPWPLLTTGWPYLARAVVRRVPGLKAFLQKRKPAWIENADD